MAAGPVGFDGKRLAAEFLVIVVGVLVALGADAAWDRTGERTREAAYLSQLEGELRITQAGVATALAQEALRLDRSDAFLAAMDHGELAASDSVDVWFDDMPRSSLYSPSLSTPATLAATGDLELIRSAEIRTTIVEIGRAISVYNRTMDLSDGMLIRAFERLGDQFDLRTVDRRSGVPIADDHRPRWSELAGNNRFRSDAYLLRNAAWNRHQALSELATSLSEASEALELYAGR